MSTSWNVRFMKYKLEIFIFVKKVYCQTLNQMVVAIVVGEKSRMVVLMVLETKQVAFWSKRERK